MYIYIYIYIYIYELYQRKPNYSDKNKSIINNSNKIIKDIELIKSLISDDKLRIPGEYYANPLLVVLIYLR